jgi:hypothetical protein
VPQRFTDQARAMLMNNIGAADTSLVVTASLADRFPVGNTSNWSNVLDWFKVTLIAENGEFEVIHVGSRAPGSGVLGNVLRGRDNTTAKAFTGGSSMVLHGPLASDHEKALAGVFAYLGISDANDPKLEFFKSGGTSAAAMFHMVAGKLTLAQSSGAGAVVTDRFTLDQSTGLLTCADIALTSDERLKTGWRGMGRHFLRRLADVKRGTYRMKGQKRRMGGVGAQSLEEVVPEFVHTDDSGHKSVSYGQAALVAAIELAQDNLELRAELADLRADMKALKARR